MAESTPRSVLVVEDNPSGLKLFRLVLEAEGYNVRAAADAREALELASEELPDLVLQDLILPDMDGIDLLRALRALPGGGPLPIVAISGFKTLLASARAEPSGFDATLIKPVESSRLVELVHSYLPLPAPHEDDFGARKWILVVDDDPIQLKLACLQLKRVGFEVMVAADGRSAIEQAQECKPDIMLCDVLMPGTDGYELCQAFRAVPGLEQVPVVLVSAFYGGPKDEKLAYDVGASALVMRTPQLEGVLGVLRNVLARGARLPSARPRMPQQEHLGRVMAQLDRQNRTNVGFADRSARQATQLSILVGIAEALLRSENVEGAFSDIMAACLDAGGISRGALYKVGEQGGLVLTQALGFPSAAQGVLECAFGCSAQVLSAKHGVVVPASGAASAADARAFFEIAGLSTAVFVPFLEADRCIGALLLGSSTAEVSEQDLTAFARAIGAHIAQALALTDSFARLREAAEAGRVLSGSLDLGETLAALARLATARLADVCEIDLVDEAPRIFTSGRACDPTLGHRLRELRAAYPRFPAYASGAPAFPSRSELIRDINDEKLRQMARNEEHLRLLSGLALSSEIVVPLLARGRVLGAVSFARVQPGRAFGNRDLVAAEDLASRAAIAIDNASLYEIAQSASRMKDEFLATVSHELRTPLTAILGWARMLIGGLGGAKREHAFRVIERNANAQAQLIEDLLDTSRIVSGQMRIDLKPIDLTSVIDLAVDSLSPTLELKKIALCRSPASEAVHIRGDAARLQQVIWNLLANAVKFSEPGGQVNIAVVRGDTHVALTVSDHGKGIDSGFLGSVFERFKQAQGGTTRAEGGLGLGLAISRHLIELHGGSISVHSAGVGRGSSFTVELPVAEATADLSASQEADPNRLPDRSAQLANVAVLVVDDDEDTRELLVEALQGCGARASGAASAAEAFAAVARERPDILLSDIGMPGEDGYELIRRIRALSSAAGGNIPAAALSAYTRSEDRSLALDAGFQLHLAKPIDPSALIEAVLRLRQVGTTARQL